MSQSLTSTQQYVSPTHMGRVKFHQAQAQGVKETQQSDNNAAESGEMSRSHLQRLAFHLHTLWLFTKSDMPTSTGINTTFAIAGILAGPGVISDASINWSDMGRGILVALYFTWHLTLCFNLGNQRQPQSIIEDGANKPWRPIPAGRISPEVTRTLQLLSIASLLALCGGWFGATHETCFYLFCTWLYNEKAWGDKTWWQRALMNACGITTNRVATLRVLIGAIQGADSYEFTDKAWGWFLIFAAIVFTTIQVQDLRDQEGDALIDRATFPLIIGDAPTRWLTAAAVLSWSALCTRYWNLGLAGYAFSIATGALVSAHMLVYRTRQHDRWSFRLVGAWWIALYFLPVMKSHGY